MRENLTIGFIGNPNCGKTTLFNAYTGANLKVANWPGVTVEKVEGAIKDHDLNIRLVDLPGTYSLTSYTMEEQVQEPFRPAPAAVPAALPVPQATAPAADPQPLCPAEVPARLSPAMP